MNSISALIIARNEQATVGKVIDESIEVLPKLTQKYEILINDDASFDRTPTILDSYAKRYSFIKIFHQKKALGISGGFEYLYEKAHYDLIFINAADGQFTIKDLPRMVEKINEGYDLVIGKRKRKIQYNLFRRTTSLMFSLLPKILFGFNLHDPGSNKLYKKKVIKLTKPLTRSIFSEAERIIRAYKLGFRITWVPIRHFERAKGTSSSINPRVVIASFLDMIRLYFALK